MPGLMTYDKRGRIKTIDPSQFPAEAWSIIGRSSGKDAEVEELWRTVPWLNRAVGILAAGLSKMPFTITDLNGEELDSSADYQNVTGIWPNPVRDLALAEAALKLFGTCYFMKQISERRPRRMPKGERGIRYLVPSTMKPLISDEVGLTGFERRIPGRTPERFEVDDVLYIWNYDPYSEIGEPTWSPAIAALSASGVLSSVDEFVELFFERGAIKTTILGVEGMPLQAERERISAVWGRIMRGLKTAWDKLVFNTGAIKPQVIGEGLESLGNSELTQEKREDISTALGVPQSMLFSNAANFAVKEGDKRDMYEETIIPDSDIIREAFNEQWLEPLGFRLRFDWHTLDIFQEDEEDRSGVIVNLTNAIVNSPNGTIASLVWQTAGAELPAGMDYDEFERIIDKAKEAGQARAEAIAENVPAPSLTPQEGTVPEEEDDPESKGLALDLSKWERKCINRLEKGKPAACAFDSDYIPAKLYGLIREMLEDVTTKEGVRAIFRAEAV